MLSVGAVLGTGDVVQFETVLDCILRLHAAGCTCVRDCKPGVNAIFHMVKARCNSVAVWAGQELRVFSACAG